MPLNIDDLRLDALIKQGNTGDIIIVGCPFDYVRKRCISKGGQENGPCCLRRFYYKVGPLYNSQYEINISEINITDSGNVRPTEEEIKSPEKVISKIGTEIITIFQSGKFPFVFGGSKQSSLGSARAFHKQFQHGKHLIISGMPFLKRPFDNDKLTSDNLVTILGSEFPNKQLLFGPHEKYFPQNYTKNFEYVSCNQIYRKNGKESYQSDTFGNIQQPVRKLKSVMKGEIPYHVTLSVEAIERFSGCRDLPLHGIKPQEMTEIFFWMGQQPNIKSIDITEFNPSCEDFESSLILLNLLYHFLMGWTKRPQSL